VTNKNKSSAPAIEKGPKVERERAPKYDRNAEPCAIAKNHAEHPVVVKDRDATINAALELVELGHTLTEIAKQLRIQRTQLISWLLREQPDKYRQAQEYIASVCAAELLKNIDGAKDQLALSRARERARVVLWLLERRYPRLYGAKGVLINIGAGYINISDELDGDALELLRSVKSTMIEHASGASNELLPALEHQGVKD